MGIGMCSVLYRVIEGGCSDTARLANLHGQSVVQCGILPLEQVLQGDVQVLQAGWKSSDVMDLTAVVQVLQLPAAGWKRQDDQEGQAGQRQGRV